MFKRVVTNSKINKNLFIRNVGLLPICFKPLYFQQTKYIHNDSKINLNEEHVKKIIHNELKKSLDDSKNSPKININEEQIKKIIHDELKNIVQLELDKNKKPSENTNNFAPLILFLSGAGFVYGLSTFGFPGLLVFTFFIIALLSP
jgi:hypothetical protein